MPTTYLSEFVVINRAGKKKFKIDGESGVGPFNS